MGDVRRLHPVLKLVLLVLIVGGAAVAVRATPLGAYLTRQGVGEMVQALRGSTWAPVLYVLTYIVATALALPGSILTLAGGAIFGLLWGTVLTTIGANIGATLAFLLARSLGRDGIERIVGDRLSGLDRATRDYGFQGLLTLRLIPLVPFNALNFGSGLTAIPWRSYAVATLVGIFPGTVVYTFFADALLQGSQEASRDALIRVLVAGALLILLSLLPTLAKKLRIKTQGRSSALPLVAWAVVAVAAVPLGAQEPDLPDHLPFARLLGKVVEGSRVDYAELQRRRGELDGYLDTLAATDPRALQEASGDERLAFWINAYNACMLGLVVDHYPIDRAGGVAGVLNRLAGRPANSVWQIEDTFTREHCTVAGEPRSQDEIEHEIVRPMGDPRIHFAVNCAARSCPRLAEDPYRAATLDRQLDRQVRLFLSDPRHFEVTGHDPATVRLNKVLDWYGEDFGGEEGVLDFLARYLPAGDSSRLVHPDTRVEYFEYDWTLNDVSR